MSFALPPIRPQTRRSPDRPASCLAAGGWAKLRPTCAAIGGAGINPAASDGPQGRAAAQTKV